MGNPICFAELQTNNPNAAKEFYGHLFDWKMEDMKLPSGAYTICHVGDGVPAGIQFAGKGEPNRWVAFIEVKNADEKLAKAGKIGGKVVKGLTVIPGFGSYGIVRDPTGAEIGFWQRG